MLQEINIHNKLPLHVIYTTYSFKSCGHNLTLMTYNFINKHKYTIDYITSYCTATKLLLYSTPTTTVV